MHLNIVQNTAGGDVECELTTSREAQPQKYQRIIIITALDRNIDILRYFVKLISQKRVFIWYVG